MRSVLASITVSRVLDEEGDEAFGVQYPESTSLSDLYALAGFLAAYVAEVSTQLPTRDPSDE